MTTIALIILALALVAWPTWRLLTLLARLAHLPPPDDNPLRFCENLLREHGASPPVTVVYGGSTDRLAFAGQFLVLTRTTGTDALRTVQLAVSCALVDATRRFPSLVSVMDTARLLGLTCQVAGISLLVAAVVTGRPSADVVALGLALTLATVVSVAVWAWDRYWACQAGAVANRLGYSEVEAWASDLADARAPGLAWYIVHAGLAAVRVVRWNCGRIFTSEHKLRAAPPPLTGAEGG